MALCCPRCVKRLCHLSNPFHRLLAFGLLTIALWTYRHWHLHLASKEASKSSHGLKAFNNAIKRSGQFIVDTPGCSIPDYDPFHQSIKNIIAPMPPLNCTSSPAITYTDGRALRINKTALEVHYNSQLERCQFERILRPLNPKSDNDFQYSAPQDFTVDVEDTKAEFLRVACFSTTGNLMYANFHTAVFTKRRVEKRCNLNFQNFRKRQRPRDILNFLIIGVDSVSRLNFIRHMPKTRRFLEEHLGAVELKGYNKVADNTFVNLAPMFAGKFVNELPWNDLMHDMPFDNYSFIWSDASSLGYRTAFAEDAPNIAIFNYDKPGFLKPPADYYLRPFSVAVEDHGSIWNSNHNCIGPKPETEVVLDYVAKFVRRFRDKPNLAFSFITRLTHDGVNKAGAADQIYHRFFKQLHHENLLKNTVVLFYSDHGMRFGEIRETPIGQLEERLPILMLSLPTHFAKKHKEYLEALKRNAVRLTTPFDIFETLSSLLHFKGHLSENDRRKRGMNLLVDIPEERTCEDAAIHSHWCTCHRHEPIKVDSDIAQLAAITVIDHINNVLSSHGDLCATLTLDKVTDARIIVPDKNMASNTRNLHDLLKDISFSERGSGVSEYIVIFRTIPGDAMFEANVIKSETEKALKISGEISRINEYGDQSACIQYYKHKMFCFCN